MAQTVTIAPRLRALYRQYFGFLGLNRAVHRILDLGVDVLARIQSFVFPAKFNWEWKLEMLTKKYEHETVALCQQIITPDMHILDIGAHIGYFSRIFSRLTGPAGVVYCFEADPENFSLLKRNTRRYPNIRLFQSAVAEHTGMIDFYHLETSTGCHSLIEPESSARKISVNAVSVDDLLARGEIARVDLIKIDIEGGEPLAMRGMQKLLTESRTIKLISEFNAGSLSAGGVEPRDFIAQLESYGFTVYGITNDGPIPLPTLMSKDLNGYLLPTGYINLYCTKEPLPHTSML
ncbi:FkbM family methyltransferase [Candidatus Kaiserbacteria bacterium]|nr:FkbM family methyltransferase [Candidatus Kaiserbacteria bacterium]